MGGVILRGKVRPIVRHELYPMSCAKTAEAIEMSFGMQSRVNPRNHVLDGVQIPRENGQF